MSVSIYRRCGGRDGSGKQFPVLPEGASTEPTAKTCQKLVAELQHGSWGYYLAAGTNPVTGKLQQSRKAGYPNRQAAQKARNAEAVKIDLGRWLAPSRDTLGEYLDKWLPRPRPNGSARQAAPETTRGQYERYIRNDIKGSALAVMKLGDIRRRHVVAFFDGLRADGRGVSTQHKMLVRAASGISRGSQRSTGAFELCRSIMLPRAH